MVERLTPFYPELAITKFADKTGSQCFVDIIDKDRRQKMVLKHGSQKWLRKIVAKNVCQKCQPKMVAKNVCQKCQPKMPAING
jgi:imidazole glycerol phosphate synthase subunit HisF